jgi:hypothetical protein
MIEDKQNKKNGIQCQYCGDWYMSRRKDRKCCDSVECRIKHNHSKFFLDNIPNLSSGTVGAISELCVSANLLNKGYSVFRSLSPSCFCDIIAIKDKTILKIEVRTGKERRDNGKISFPKQTHGEVDCYGVYERSKNRALFFNLSGQEIEL